MTHHKMQRLELSPQHGFTDLCGLMAFVAGFCHTACITEGMKNNGCCLRECLPAVRYDAATRKQLDLQNTKEIHVLGITSQRISERSEIQKGGYGKFTLIGVHYHW